MNQKKSFSILIATLVFILVYSFSLNAEYSDKEKADALLRIKNKHENYYNKFETSYLIKIIQDVLTIKDTEMRAEAIERQKKMVKDLYEDEIWCIEKEICDGKHLSDLKKMKSLLNMD